MNRYTALWSCIRILDTQLLAALVESYKNQPGMFFFTSDLYNIRRSNATTQCAAAAELYA